MSTPLATCLSACSAFPASAATSMPRSWAFAMTSGGGGPSAFAISRARWASATSTCLRATECSQPRTPSAACAPSGSGGTPSLSSVCSTKSLCPSGISWSRSRAAPSAGTRAGMTTLMPYGRPPVLASIQSRARSSSAGSLKRTQPSTPRPPARLTAAATCSDGVKPTMGCSMPRGSHSAVRRWAVLRRAVLRWAVLRWAVLRRAAGVLIGACSGRGPAGGRRRTGGPIRSRPCRTPCA